MWFFNYFAGSYIFASTLTSCYDLFIGYHKHKNRSFSETTTEIIKIIPNVVFNLVFITLPYTLLLEKHIEDKPRNNYGVIFNIVMSYFVTDILFYSTHRLLHLPALYFIHKKHHEYEFPIGIGAMYAHPVDFFFTNLIPFTFPVFFYPPTYIIKLIIIISISTTVIQSHGGYTFLNSGHLDHHRYYKINYGLGPMDRLLGTHR